MAGSVEAREQVGSLLAEAGAPYVLADNVVPRIGVLAPESARAALELVWLETVDDVVRTALGDEGCVERDVPVGESAPA